MEPLGTGSLEMVVKFRLWGSLGPSSASQARMQLCWACEAVEGEEGIDRSGLLIPQSSRLGRAAQLSCGFGHLHAQPTSCHCIVLLFWFNQSIKVASATEGT